MVYMLLAEGFETIEALGPADILRRGEIPLRLASLDGKPVASSHGVQVDADMALADAKADGAEMVILPGGPGVEKLEAYPAVLRLVREAYENGAYIAAICAAPAILADLGLLKGRQATCYPDAPYTDRLKDGGADYREDAGVVADGPVITAKAAGVSLDFGLTLLEILKGHEAAEKVKAAIYYNA